MLIATEEIRPDSERLACRQEWKHIPLASIWISQSKLTSPRIMKNDLHPLRQSMLTRVRILQRKPS